MILAYDLDSEVNASHERVVIQNIEGSPDGLRVAANGNLYIACKGIAIYTPAGELPRIIPKHRRIVPSATPIYRPFTLRPEPQSTAFVFQTGAHHNIEIHFGLG
jgi:sugar lactone lactonase YvrE